MGTMPIDKRYATARGLLKLVSLTLLVLVGLLTATPTNAQSETDVADLWIDFSIIRPTLADVFADFSQMGDYARVEHLSQIALLDTVEATEKIVIFKSARDAQRVVPAIADQITAIGYNIENGPANPQDEKDDPVAFAADLRELADEYELKLIIGPDRRFALSHGDELAAYADVMVLQVQRVQTQPSVVLDFVLPLSDDFRAVNPNVEVSIQIRTEGDVRALYSLVESMLGSIDGVSILTSAETVNVAARLVNELRGDRNGTDQAQIDRSNDVGNLLEQSRPTPANTSGRGASDPAATAPTSTPRGVTEPTPIPTIPLPPDLPQVPAQNPEQPTSLRALALIFGGTALFIGAGVFMMRRP